MHAVFVVCNYNYMPSAKQDEAAHPQEQIRGWFTRRLPEEWFEGAPMIVIDREEITIIGHLPSPAATAATADEVAARAANTAATATEARRNRPEPTPRRRLSAAAGGFARKPVMRGLRSPGRRSTRSAASCPGASSVTTTR